MRVWLVLLPLFAVLPAGAGPAFERLVVETPGGDRVFEVEVVSTAADRNRGLMFRRSLPAHRGMLFDYDPPQPVSFWMKNTYISLDIVFIGEAGRIISIAERTKPLSLAPIPSGGPARAVLELNAGSAKRLGIAVGARVRHRLFGT